jgi:hypothetical protein
VDQDTIPVGALHELHGCRGPVKSAGEVGGKSRVDPSWTHLRSRILLLVLLTRIQNLALHARQDDTMRVTASGSLTLPAATRASRPTPRILPASASRDSARLLVRAAGYTLLAQCQDRRLANSATCAGNPRNLTHKLRHLLLLRSSSSILLEFGR